MCHRGVSRQALATGGHPPEPAIAQAAGVDPERLPEVVPLGLASSHYPERIVARAGFEGELAKRTLTKLDNQRLTWLAQAHARLDAAVAAAYGWADWRTAMPNDEILRRLPALNRARAAAS